MDSLCDAFCLDGGAKEQTCNKFKSKYKPSRGLRGTSPPGGRIGLVLANDPLDLNSLLIADYSNN